MKTKIEKAVELGFCFGVRRAIELMEKAAHEHGYLDSLGEVVHNEQVLKRLSSTGVRVINNMENITNPAVAISSHGVPPQIESRLKAKGVKVIDTTCSFVRRAQLAARDLAEAGYFVIVFGDPAHPEVKGILGWAKDKGIAILNVKEYKFREGKHRKIGILAQTTQVPEHFTHFVQEIIGMVLNQDTEIRIIDTICHEIRKRQSVSQGLAQKVDLMLVVGGKTSANTKRLLELCSENTETHRIGSADEIKKIWLKGKKHIGITSGTSTPEETVNEIVDQLEKMLN